MVNSETTLSPKEMESLLDEYNSPSIMLMASEWFKKNKPMGKLPAITALVEVLNDKQKVAGVVRSLGPHEMSCLFFAENQTSGTPLSVHFGSLRTGYPETDAAIFRLLKRGLLLIENGPFDTRLHIQDISLNMNKRIFPVPAARGLVSPPRHRPLSLPMVSGDLVKKSNSPSASLFLEKLLKITQLTKVRKIRLNGDGSIGANYWKLFFKEVDGVKLGIWKTPGKQAPSGEGEAVPVPFVLDAALTRALSKTDIVSGRFFLGGLLKLFKNQNREWLSLEEFVDLVIGFDKKILFYAVRRPHFCQSLHGPEDNFEKAVQREFIRCFIVLTCSRLGVVDIGTTGEPERPYLPGRPDWRSFNLTSSGNMRCVTKEGERRRAWETKASHIVFRFTDLGREALFGEKEQKKNKTPSMLIGADFEIIVEKKRERSRYNDGALNAL